MNQMKKHLLLASAAFIAFAGLVSCGREHKCKCFYTDDPTDAQYKVFVVDGSIDCEDFVMMGYEEHVATEGVNSLHRVDTVRINCRDFGE